MTSFRTPVVTDFCKNDVTCILSCYFQSGEGYPWWWYEVTWRKPWRQPWRSLNRGVSLKCLYIIAGVLLSYLKPWGVSSIVELYQLLRPSHLESSALSFTLLIWHHNLHKIFIPPKIYFLYPKQIILGVYWNRPVGLSVGWSIRRLCGLSAKILSVELLLQFQPDSLET